jgi:hypothetical protein
MSDSGNSKVTEPVEAALSGAGLDPAMTAASFATYEEALAAIRASGVRPTLHLPKSGEIPPATAKLQEETV